MEEHISCSDRLILKDNLSLTHLMPSAYNVIELCWQKMARLAWKIKILFWNFIDWTCECKEIKTYRNDVWLYRAHDMSVQEGVIRRKSFELVFCSHKNLLINEMWRETVHDSW